MKRTLLNLLLVLPFFAYSQSNFQKGYVVTLSKDTLRGFIDYQERTASSSSINFKSTSGKVEKYTVDNSLGYGMDDMQAFEQYLVDISLSQIAISQLSSGLDSTKKTDRVFLKVLQKGKNVSLFSYKDDIKERFYIKTKNDIVPIELIRNMYLKADESTMSVTDIQYARQLLSVMRDLNNGISNDESKLVGLAYKENELLKVVSLINKQEQVKSKFKNSRFFVGGGAMLTSLSYNGNNELASPDAKSKKSVLPYITVGIDVFLNPVVKKFIFRNELGFSMDKNEISKSDANALSTFVSHSFKAFNISYSPQFIFNVYNAENLKAFFGVGAVISYSIYSDNLYQRNIGTLTVVQKDYIVLKPVNIAVPLIIGAVINKRIEIAAGCTLPSGISDYVAYSVKLERYKIGFKYLFGKN